VRTLGALAIASLLVGCSGSSHPPVLGDIRGPGLTGESVDAATIHSRVVVVNFFGSWCGPCREEADDLASAARAFRTRGVTFLGVAERENSRLNASVFLHEHHVPYAAIYDDSGLVLARAGLGIGIPTTLIFKRGRLVRRIDGAVLYTDLVAALRTAVRGR
jgi:thiol-disulfide isomerase/thioredoxin